MALLRGLLESRVMALPHIAALYFDGSREAAKKRLQKLKSGGFVAERPRRTNEPSALLLTAKGLKTLADQGILRNYPDLGRTAWAKRSQVSDLTLNHELEVMAVKASLMPAINRLDRFKAVEFSTWPLLHQFTIERSAFDPRTQGAMTVKPDGFLRVEEREADGGRAEHTFYLEVDCSTEPQKTLGQKGLAYLNHYRKGGLAVRNGASPEQFREFPFRVLFVVRSAERRDNAAERLLAGTPPIKTMVWLTTLEEITSDPLGAIWVRPKDWRDAVVHTYDDQLAVKCSLLGL